MKIRPLKKAELKYLSSRHADEVNSVYLTLLLSDFQFDPEELTSKLKMLPTNSFSKSENQLLDTKRNRFENNFWEYEEKHFNTDFLGDLADEFILRILKNKIETLKSLSNDCHIMFRVVQYYNQSNNPGFSLSKKSLKVLAEIEAEFDLDIYSVYDEKKKRQ